MYVNARVCISFRLHEYESGLLRALVEPAITCPVQEPRTCARSLHQGNKRSSSEMLGISPFYSNLVNPVKS